MESTSRDEPSTMGMLKVFFVRNLAANIASVFASAILCVCLCYVVLMHPLSSTWSDPSLTIMPTYHVRIILALVVSLSIRIGRPQKFTTYSWS